MAIGQKIQKRFLTNFFNVLNITIIFIFLIVYYSVYKSNYAAFDILDIYKETINPNCTTKKENIETILNPYGFLQASSKW